MYPKIWVQGFLPTINDDRATHVCRDCGKEGMLLRFESEEERAKFAAETRGDAALATVPHEPATDAIPILPIDAVPLVEIRGIDAVPIYRSKVVDVLWDGGKLHRGAYRVDVDTYWGAVGGPRYNAERVLVLDLGGINHGDPNFDALRKLGKRATVLVDLGARDTEDVMDGFMVDVEAVVAGTKAIERVDQFREIRELSEGVIPCIDVDGGVVWAPLSKEGRDLRPLAAALRDFGFTRLAVMDLARLGTFRGPDPALLAQLAGLEFELYVGGGIREEDVPKLREAGIDGGLVDPYTPVIQALLPTKEETAPADAVPAPRPARDIRGTAAPG